MPQTAVMHTDKAIEVLNTLITINNDRIEGYDTALNETEEIDLRVLFAHFSDTSKKCKHELVAEVLKLNGKPATGTLTSGKFFRVWMDVKAAITGKDRKAILNSCDFGEVHAINIYTELLEQESDKISIPLRTMILEQKTRLVSDHNRVKALRDALVRN